MSKSHFNTSNVTIQLIERHWKATGGVISIHLMLLFNFKRSFSRCSLMHFNTSNVTIQLVQQRDNVLFHAYFNTSNVTIQLPEFHFYKQPAVISIHLMLLFNRKRRLRIRSRKSDFNTSNVTIQPTILSHLFYSQFHYTHYISTFS